MTRSLEEVTSSDPGLYFNPKHSAFHLIIPW